MAKKREPGPLKRVLDIDGNKWQWECGKEFVKMRNPHGQTKTIPIYVVLGIGRVDWIEKINDGYRPEVKPSHITEYARRQF